MLDRLKELQRLNRVMQDLQSKEKSLSKPTITDPSRICEVKNIVREHCRETEFSWKDYFIVVALFLYQPKALIGEKLIDGMRPAFAAALNVREDQVSRFIKKTRGYLDVYKDFRELCTFITAIVLDKISHN